MVFHVFNLFSLDLFQMFLTMPSTSSNSCNCLLFCHGVLAACSIFRKFVLVLWLLVFFRAITFVFFSSSGVIFVVQLNVCYCSFVSSSLVLVFVVSSFCRLLHNLVFVVAVVVGYCM